MENTIKVTITPEHFSKAKNYLFDCPLEVALKSQLPENTFVSAGSTYVCVGDERYIIPEKWGRHISSDFTPYVIDELILQSKTSLENIPSIELELTLQK